jgi:hypothetical protein
MFKTLNKIDHSIFSIIRNFGETHDFTAKLHFFTDKPFPVMSAFQPDILKVLKTKQFAGFGSQNRFPIFPKKYTLFNFIFTFTMAYE